MENVGQSASPTSGKLQGRGAQTDPQRPRQALGMEDLRTPTTAEGRTPGSGTAWGIHKEPWLRKTPLLFPSFDAHSRLPSSFPALKE